ncbi:ImmA/IrrE family metallo-endopeptidase [Lactococcus raffinolactis]|uniref:ImmA/IrrE family metallo-endopeptidase n=1 Tax=Pseudolactococcus raffinolactis TaxID=1366 RepID=UPI002892836A|nr:ImmA/IrrE family metallo-endopeptidase [Lactococcus raffinolactis]MDT2766512.1 ImmA/IrrE family metallo-endopeptidase [Lactococcus raffinolactis]MDT2789672.1 ImmA/IrrE family metallo-endopeptidase [Lactococcus raffinolactis]
MLNSLKNTINDMGVEVVIAHGISRDGLYLPETETIFVRYGLTDEQAKNVILHELGHLICKHADTPLSSPYYHSKQESQADDFWLEELAKEYLNNFDYFPDYINIYTFLKAYQIGPKYYDKANAIFTKIGSKELA